MTQQEKHGWLIVASLFVTMLLIVGSGYNATPVFVPALLKTFGWSRAKVSFRSDGCWTGSRLAS